jgi:NADPH:quinone reductase-like Zn-dependent oxidoreductase
VKAIVYEEYGTPDVLQLKEVEKPAPKDKEILVQNYATSVKYGDILARKIKFVSPREFNMPWLFWFMAKISFGFRKPKISILGSEFAGVIESTGQGVTRFKQGEQVFGYLGQRMGAYAEYLCMPDDGIVTLKPANMTFQEAATFPYGSIMALNLLRKVNIGSGQKVLVIGASGAIGSAAVQLTRHYGAEVSGVCSTSKVEFVKSLGANKVIDYTQEDITQSGENYDLIFDVLGRSSFARSKASLKQDGVHLYVSFKMKQLGQMIWTSRSGSQRVICALASEKPEDLVSIKELFEAGRIKAHLEKSFPLEQAAEAHRYVEGGSNKGPVAITVTDDGKNRNLNTGFN